MKGKNQQRTENPLIYNIFKMSSREPFSSRYQGIFLGYYFLCTNFRHKVRDCKAYDINDYKSNYHTSRRKFASRKYPNVLNRIKYTLVAPSFKYNT